MLLEIDIMHRASLTPMVCDIICIITTVLLLLSPSLYKSLYPFHPSIARGCQRDVIPHEEHPFWHKVSFRLCLPLVLEA